jgi:hypothetical protein
MCFCSWENHRTKWANLQQTMCDYQRVVWVCHGLSENWGYPHRSTIIVPIDMDMFGYTHIQTNPYILILRYIYNYSHIELQIYMVVDFLATTVLLTPNTTVLTYRWHKYVCLYIHIYIYYIYICVFLPVVVYVTIDVRDIFRYSAMSGNFIDGFEICNVLFHFYPTSSPTPISQALSTPWLRWDV